jgi:hypothetical protein
MKKILIIVVLAGIFSCEEIDQPMTGEFTEASFWRDEKDALDALSSCYENMLGEWLFFGNEALSDNAYLNGTELGGSGLIGSGSYDGRTSRIKDEWGYRYTGIRKCNMVLENIDKVAGVTDALKNRISAEARFIRAYHHFQLSTWYGDVPLVAKVITLSESKTISRTPKSEVITFVLSELQGIQTDLPVTYGDADRGRITRGAAIALRARVNLQESNWQAVVDDCEKLINTTANGTFGLYNNYGNLFTVAAEYNNEVILDLQYAGSRLYSRQRIFLPPTIGKLRSNLVPTQSLVDAYITVSGKTIDDPSSGYDESDPYINRDPRLEYTVIHHGSQVIDFQGVTQTILTQPGSSPVENSIDNQIASRTGYYFQKYYDRTAVEFNSGLNLIMIRFADILLMYAEAKNELNQMTADVWDKTIRKIRERAGFTQASALDFNSSLLQGQLREIIRRERRAELAFEGLRIYDIKRWQIADQVLNQPSKGIKITSGQFPQDDKGYIIVQERIFQASKHYLWPVPFDEMVLNPNLAPNNTGW